ncbi:MAG: hypothetical protein ABIK98_00720 [Pseudomonadota bacterium]|nr:hypothetical protein [Pseudomonadota bacterium]
MGEPRVNIDKDVIYISKKRANIGKKLNNQIKQSVKKIWILAQKKGVKKTS